MQKSNTRLEPSIFMGVIDIFISLLLMSLSLALASKLPIGKLF